jgi:hypothetical protein
VANRRITGTTGVRGVYSLAFFVLAVGQNVTVCGFAPKFSGSFSLPDPHSVTRMPATTVSLLTAQESLVIAALEQRAVRSMAWLRATLRLSRMTVFRALSKHGYFSSFNHNGRFYTLAERPRFDGNGLWFYRTIGFSRQRTLPATLLALVEASSTGQTPAELAGLLHTPVGNLLAELARQGRLGRQRLGHHVVYLASAPRRREQQLRQRQQASPDAVAEPPPAQPPLAVVLPVLAEVIRSPGATPKQWLRSLRNSGLSLQPEQLQAIIGVCQLEKKEAL